MRSILLPMRTSALLSMAWVNGTLLQVEHDGSKYLLCSLDHAFTDEEAKQYPIELTVRYPVGDTRHIPAAMIKNNSPEPIRVGTGFPIEANVGNLRGKSSANFLFRSPAEDAGQDFKFKEGLEGHYIIISSNKHANVDYETWQHLTKTHLMYNVNN
ncbi:hypothetical protein PGT21_013677 [Puccinia graminis f. sp. tritici]|uniref:Uncharacterized protein n=1 Tax=Puccinia graminis f. sp. tritici TaxID=56615 RepID=A0A5B0Q2T0_PUCGR|nr:hypothetical protein PGT21_013677 [Puccinia graminis f. sp. tritici]KAA1124766.1 hypothetical protein PGTUg99_034048 [Puccinia graminis f. sp. tritici]